MRSSEARSSWEQGKPLRSDGEELVTDSAACSRETLLRDLRGRQVTVFGLGREGIDLARFLVREGARVRLTDQKGPEQLREALAALADLDVSYSLGGHPTHEVLAADLLFVSPGIASGTVPALVEARQRGIPISSATELFFERCTRPIVGITGSSGKSTTTALVGEMLRATGLEVVVGGNIGQPLLGRLADLGPKSIVVMELSSFQLETLNRSPAVAAITNVTPNHLDRHETMAAYVAAKARIFQFQRAQEWTVLNADDSVSREFQPPGRVARFSLERRVHGAYLAENRLVLERDGQRIEICAAADLVLRGRHNLANALTASLTSALSGGSVEAMRQVLRTFHGLPHRLQLVGEVGGIAFYDDSIATSPERSMAALDAFEEGVVLLAGGRDKHLPMDEWARAIRKRASGVVLFGEASGLIGSALDRAGYPADRIRQAATIAAAVRAGYELAEAGQVVLLSPGCTSYDMFRDFVERGQVFAAAVHELASEQG